MELGQAQLDELRQKYCSRKVTVNRKLERTNKDAQMFFNRIIDDLEKELTIPNYLKEDYLRTMVQKTVFHKIERILPLIRQTKPDSSSEEEKSLRKPPSNQTNYSSQNRQSVMVLVGTSTSSSKKAHSIPESLATAIPEHRHEILYKEPITTPLPMSPQKPPKKSSKTKSLEPKEPDPHVEKRHSALSSGLDTIILEILNFRKKPKLTMYANFFKKTPANAAIWRDVKKRAKREGTAQQIADYIARDIARKFVEWSRESGMDTTLTEQEILNLFSPARDNNKLHVRHEEVYAIPGQVGWNLGMQHRTTQNVLLGQIKADRFEDIVPYVL